MEITNFLLVSLALILSFQVLNAKEYGSKEVTKLPFNPLENLILNKNQNGIESKPLSRVKRQFSPYYGGIYPDYYPVPIILPIGFGGFGAGYGRGFGGRGFGGRGYGGRGFGGRGFGGSGFGGRGFGGRAGGFGGGRGGRG